MAELTKLGATVEEGHDYCIITPPKEVRLILPVPAPLHCALTASHSLPLSACGIHSSSSLA